MKLIVGLGNPGSKYAATRHNVGFVVIEMIRRLDKLPEKTVLLTPQTFMNESGVAVSEKVRFYKLSLSDLLVIHDDVDLPLGVVRLQKDRSSAGHKGVLSIINSLGTQDFFRIRVGIGKPMGELTVEEYVLQEFKVEEKVLLKDSIKEAAELAINWTRG